MGCNPRRSRAFLPGLPPASSVDSGLDAGRRIVASRLPVFPHHHTLCEAPLRSALQSVRALQANIDFQIDFLARRDVESPPNADRHLLPAKDQP